MTSFRSYFFLAFFLLASANLALADESDLPFKIPRNYNSLPETALLETTKGPIEIAFYRETAPVTVRNFEYLSRKGFYKGLSFHRYVKNFIVQGGDPKGNGKGGPGYTLPPEFSNISHVEGTLGMAKKPDPVNPERQSNGSQFYICLNRAKHLDGLYTVFARVINGIENAKRLREGDKIIDVLFPIR